MTFNSWYQGVVLHGDKYGHTLGFPTANLDPAILSHLGQDGVYAAIVSLGDRTYGGAIYLGPRLTLRETRRVLEIHLIDFSGDIYGQTLRFRLGAFIRPPQDFSSVKALKAQLAADITAARRHTEA